jgi:AIPR protein
MNIYEFITNDIRQQYYQQNFSNDGQRFIAWYLRNIHLTDLDETRYDITDGEGDKQIDAVVVDDANSLTYIIQGKFIGSNKVDSEPLMEVLSSWGQLHDLSRLQENANTKLKRRLVDIGRTIDDEYEIVFELITTGELTPVARNDLGAFQEILARGDAFQANLNIVDGDELVRRYEVSLEKENPLIDYELTLQDNNYVSMDNAGTRAVIAAIPLKECIKLTGIRDGTLFQKNVRQSLGLDNRVNKSMKATIFSDKHKDFFFYHNGITAICNKLELVDKPLSLKGLSVVNGCQSLNTILSCSERVKQLEDTSILFRFYEIPQRDRADRISICTNFQTAVKPRDLRSNDKRVLNLKRMYEQTYPDGYLITKRGEEAPPSKNKDYVIDLAELGKWMASWQSKRPNIAYSETKLFDKYFVQLFRREYRAEDIQGLNSWMTHISKHWISGNPLGINESLLAMKAYAIYHHLYTISQCFSIQSNHPQWVPRPSTSYNNATKHNLVNEITIMAADILSTAMETAPDEQQISTRVFSPQNWIKSKSCLIGIDAAARTQLRMMLRRNDSEEIKDALTLRSDDFEYRWEGTD